MKKLFVTLTLFSLFNLTTIKAEEPEDGVTTYEVTEETTVLGEEVPVDNAIDENQIEEKVYATNEETELDDKLLTTMSGDTKDYTIFYVAIGGVVILMISLWAFLFSKAKHMAKN